MPEIPSLTRSTPAVRGAKPLLVVAALALLALSLGSVGAESAHAAPKGVVGVFGQAGSGAGEFQTPAGVAVNQTTGDVYVVDVANERVQQFDADGTFIRMWGWGVSDGSAELQVCTSDCQAGIAGPGDGQFMFNGESAGIAVAPDGSVYVADTGNHRVQKFTAAGGFLAQIGTPGSGDGEFLSPIAVAVDPSDGDLLVADRDNARIQRFTVAGAYESQFTGPDGTLTPHRVAVDSAGAIYVLEFFNRVQKFDSTGQNPVVLAPDELVRLPLDMAVNISNDHVLVTQYEPGFTFPEILEYDASGTRVETHRSAGFEARGLAVRASSGRIYSVDGGTPRVFILDDPVHTATVAPTTDVTARTATLHGTVNPGGGFDTRYRFEVSADEGQTWTPFPEVDVEIGNGTVDVPVTQAVSGLEPNQDYLVRIVATKDFGSQVISTGTEGSFTTDPLPPDVETFNATAIGTTSAGLQGEINPNNLETTYRFDYGPTGAYGFSIPVPERSAGDDGSPLVVIESIGGLTPDTEYHFRLVATNDEGTTFGPDRTFRTRASATPPQGRGYELVSPADKVGGTGVGQWYQGPQMSAQVGYGAHVGERFAVLGYLGSVLIEGPYTYSTDWALAERTPEGWVSKPGVSRRAYGSQAKADISMLAAAEDLSLSAWGSAHLLRLFPEMEFWIRESVDNPVTFLRDWTSGQWEVFGPTDQAQGNSSLSNAVVAPDGSAAALSTSTLRGLAGDRDPTLDLPGVPGQPGNPGSIYLEEVDDGWREAFPGDDGVRELVNVCTAGTELPVVVDPGTGDPPKLSAEDCPARASNRDWRLTSPRGAALSEDTKGIISTDGSRIFFMSPDPAAAGSGCEGAGVDAVCPPQLFVWQRDSAGNPVTRWISRPEVANQDASLLGAALFEGASADGDKVFFRTSSPLTADDPNGSGAPPAGGVTTGTASDESWDLYMYDLPDDADADPADGELVRISGGPQNDSDCNASTGTLRFVSEDGSRAYFACAAPLSGVDTPGSGTVTTPGGDPTTTDASNLYLYDTGETAPQRWRFIARLPRTGALGSCATTARTRSDRCFNGTPDGSLATFMTGGRLTGDDPDPISGDIYGYDALRGELTRLSRPETTGPVGTYQCRTDLPCYGDDGFRTGRLPLERLGVALRPDGDRLAFFESRSRLVAEDTDNAYDVYQWRNGDLSLISTGKSATDGAFFVGNDKSGLNVYFATRDRLTWQDRDAVLDIYTARVGGGIPEPPAHQICQLGNDSCQGPGAAVPGQPPIASKRPGSGNASKPTARIAALSRKARRRAIRTGVLRLRVRVAKAGILTVSAKARLGGRSRRVAAARKRVTRAGTVTVRLRLNASARRRLGSGKGLALRITASMDGSPQDAARFTLKGRGR